MEELAVKADLLYKDRGTLIVPNMDCIDLTDKLKELTRLVNKEIVRMQRKPTS